MDPLDALSPLDGRYADDLGPLRSCFSERGLITRRVRVELRYLQALLDTLGTPADEKLKTILAQLESDPGLVSLVKQHEVATRHDVKAVEYALARTTSPRPSSASSRRGHRRSSCSRTCTGPMRRRSTS